MNFEYLRVSVTDRCNLRCQYCMPPEGIKKLRHEQILSFEEIIKIIEAAVSEGVFRVRITGGEPLVRKGLVEFVKLVSQIKGITDLSITTNGILLKEFAKPLFNSGIRRVNISLDSLNPKNFNEITRGGDIKRVLNGIDSAIEVGMQPVKINVVLIPEKNDDEIESFVNLAFQKPVHVRFIERMPFSSELKDSPFISESSVLKLLEKNFSLEPQPYSFGGPASLFSLNGGAGVIGFISPRSQPFCSKCTRLRLTSSGDLMPCLESIQKVNVREMKKNVIQEKIRELSQIKSNLGKQCGIFQHTNHTSLSSIGG